VGTGKTPKTEKRRGRHTLRQTSLIASSPCTNNVRIAKKLAILTLSLAEDHKSRRTYISVIAHMVEDSARGPPLDTPEHAFWHP
jgi:hypothetical protein